MIFLCRKSGPRLEKFKELTGRAPLIDVCTRWGSTNAMIERALECKEAYGAVLHADSLDELVPDDLEYRRLSILREVLQLFDKCTTIICASKSYATIHLTVIVYNNLMQHIEDFRDNNVRHPDLDRGVKAAFQKLKKYYAATDKSPIYTVATALHPTMRFKYWSDQKWGHFEGIAKRTARETWVNQYAEDTSDVVTQPLQENDDEDEFSLLGFSSTTPMGDELEDFVSRPRIKEKPLVYWRRHCDEHPRLAMMARDFFAVPASSASSERCFSKARSLLPYTRNRLCPVRIKEQMLLNSWYDYFQQSK